MPPSWRSGIPRRSGLEPARGGRRRGRHSGASTAGSTGCAFRTRHARERFAFLVALGPTEDLEAGALHFDTKANDATTLAAKRALNSGDAMLLERRARGARRGRRRPDRRARPGARAVGLDRADRGAPAPRRRRGAASVTRGWGAADERRPETRTNVRYRSARGPRPCIRCRMLPRLAPMLRRVALLPALIALALPALTQAAPRPQESSSVWHRHRSQAGPVADGSEGADAHAALDALHARPPGDALRAGRRAG